MSAQGDLVQARPTRPFVSILIPTLDEERYLAAAIASIAPGDAEIDYEILVLDGGSSDRTCEIATALGKADPRIRLVRNERKLQSAAINLGAASADQRAAILIRADCHALYPPEFVAVCVRKLQESAARSVVVNMVTVGKGGFQCAVALAQNSRLGNGGSPHRMAGASRYIDHGHHAAFDRHFFLAIGGYDELLDANEDFDLDARLHHAGGRIWLETSIPVTYFPRETVRGLARQYYRYGRGRAQTYRRHRYALKLRQLAPLLILLGNAGALLGVALLSPVLLAVPLCYLLLCLAVAAGTAEVRQHPGRVAPTALAALIMHHAWGLGFLAGAAGPVQPFVPKAARQDPVPQGGVGGAA